MVLDFAARNSCFQALAGFCDYVMASVADHDFFGRHKMTKRFLAGVVLCGALLAASSLQAHHSLAGVYDLKKVERATGVVQKLAFTNPHGALHIELKNAEGVAKVWQLTTGSANVLTTPGITATGPDRIKNGDDHRGHLQSGAQRYHHRFSQIDYLARQERSRVCPQLTTSRH